MKKYIFPVFAIATLLTACQNNDSSKKNADTAGVDTNIVATNSNSCYSYIKNRDTANLTFMSTNGIVTGKLNYKLYEKDSNTGSIEGEMKGDTLLATYTFNSEGKESVRQVAFLKKGNQLIEGYGDAEEQNGKTMFKNTAILNFTNSIVFEKVDCK